MEELESRTAVGKMELSGQNSHLALIAPSV